MIRFGAALILLLATSAPGTTAAAKKGESAEDPSREVCKSRPVVGSRLKRVRTCMTAQQWEEMKWMERQGLLRRQINGDPGCSEAAGCNMRPGAKDSPI